MTPSKDVGGAPARGVGGAPSTGWGGSREQMELAKHSEIAAGGRLDPLKQG